MKQCATCRLWMTVHCGAYQTEGKHPGSLDWCMKHKLIGPLDQVRPVTRKVMMMAEVKA